MLKVSGWKLCENIFDETESNWSTSTNMISFDPFNISQPTAIILLKWISRCSEFWVFNSCKNGYTLTIRLAWLQSIWDTFFTKFENFMLNAIDSFENLEQFPCNNYSSHSNKWDLILLNRFSSPFLFWFCCSFQK